MALPSNPEPGLSGDSGASGSRRLTVSEFTRHVKHIIEDELPFVIIEGEISNYVHHSSGHRYFSLKDSSSQLKCVMFKWQAQKLAFKPDNGAQVLIFGTPTVYEPRGEYQVNVQRMQPLGQGDLLLMLEQLKAKLSAEGVFDNQRPLPQYPSKVAIVTSPTGAAVRDMINVLGRRAPHVRILLRPALVQGEGAAADIARAIAEIDAVGEADLMIVGRGGGSIEDLWAFNEEPVARAIHASSIPVISAVGHETDVTLADFAADLRAPTPSAGAELAVRDSRDMKDMLASYTATLRRSVLDTVDRLSGRVDLVLSGFKPERFMQQLMMKSQHVDECGIRMKAALAEILSQREKQAETLEGKLVAMNPKAVLDRGYSIVYRETDKRVVDDTSLITDGDRVHVELAKGSFNARVES